MQRYKLGARLYDLVSLEWPVYRRGREVGIEALALRPGDRVLDVGCGTGLNFSLLSQAIGTSGSIVGIDASASMLEQAQNRIDSAGWKNVTLIKADAGVLADAVDGPFDAVIFTYSLSIIDDWKQAWTSAKSVLRSGGKICVVDLAAAEGWGRIFAPLIRFACFTGGVQSDRKVWQLVEQQGKAPFSQSLRSGHIRVAVATFS